MGKNIIRTENLTKRFGDVTAVENVSIHLQEGEIYGFLGLNGAGKTTTIRLLLGLIKADNGISELFGKSPRQSSNIWNDIGYLIETPHAYPNLTVEENLELVRLLRGIKDRTVIDRIIDQLKLKEYRNRKERDLSLGNKQRLGLAKALIHNPRLLLLDEPINGLDPAGIVEVRELLKGLAGNHNTTIFISSHILSEIAKLASRIGIIHNGKLIKEIESSDLHNQIIKKLYVQTNNDSKAAEIISKEGFEVIKNNDRIEMDDERVISKPEIISALLAGNGIPPRHLSIYEEDLEHYFLRMIKGE